MKPAVVVLVTVTWLVVTALAQALSFEVASVKENKSGSPERGFGFQPGGRFGARNMTLRGLIAAAYGSPQPLPNFRVLGGQNWIDAVRFDIDARTNEADATPGWSTNRNLLLRALLVERFRLVAHQETRDVPAYAMLLARKDGALGPHLRPSTGTDCEPPRTGGVPAPSSAITCGSFRFTPPEGVSGRSLTMEGFARFVMLNTVDRPVVDQTGLAGSFSMDLEFSRDPSVGSGTPIFTALSEQLGLKLEPIKTPLEVVIIDSVERPTEN